MQELIAIIIGKGSYGNPATMIGHHVMTHFKELTKLSDATLQEITQIEGIGPVKACQLLASVELANRINQFPAQTIVKYTKPSDIAHVLKPYFVDKQKEYFVVASLNSRMGIIGIDTISIGTVDSTVVHPREVFHSAITRRASYVVLAHNHPSGVVEPSPQDLAVTNRLMDVSYAVGIPIIDHIIITDSNFISLKEHEYIVNDFTFDKS